MHRFTQQQLFKTRSCSDLLLVTVTVSIVQPLREHQVRLARLCGMQSPAFIGLMILIWRKSVSDSSLMYTR